MGLQFAMLLALNLVALARTLSATRRVPTSFLVTFALGAVSILPTPTFEQYFSTAVPFMIINVMYLPSLGGLRRRPSHAVRRVGIAAMALVSFVYVGAGVADAYSYTSSGRILSLPPEYTVSDWRIGTVTRISRAIHRYRVPGCPVLTWWPGYLVESGATIFHGLEHETADFTLRLSAQERLRYQVISEVEIVQALSARRAGIVVVGNLVDTASQRRYEQLLAQHGYSVRARVGRSWIFVVDGSCAHD